MPCWLRSLGPQGPEQGGWPLLLHTLCTHQPVQQLGGSRFVLSIRWLHSNVFFPALYKGVISHLGSFIQVCSFLSRSYKYFEVLALSLQPFVTEMNHMRALPSRSSG